MKIGYFGGFRRLPPARKTSSRLANTESRMSILVTGGAGFIGSHIVSRLLDQGEQVIIVDNFNDFYDPSIKRKNVLDLQSRGALDVCEVDILDTEGLRKVFAEARPQVVIHLAAWAGVRPSLERPALYSSVNVTGTVHLLELAREFRVPCFIFGSSSSVYGGSRRVPFTEDDPADNPVSPYAATKRAGELLCRTYSHNFGLRITCLRFFTVYGPRQRPEMAIHKFARLIWEGREVPVFGDGSSRRDYTYVDDIVQGVLSSVRVNPGFAVINLGESQTVSLLELIRLLEGALGRKARLQFLPEQAGDMAITYADISRARELLGYNPSTPVQEGLRRFAEWFLQTQRSRNA
jgi:UDP-glucuronate 4-epimerase